MSNQQHTKEPWRVELVNHALGDTGDYEGVVEIRAGDAKRALIEIFDDSDVAESNARRIVACVNACAGIPTDDLELCPNGGLLHLAAHADQLVGQRDELLKVAQGILAEDMLQYLPAEYVANVRAAIASAKGGS